MDISSHLGKSELETVDSLEGLPLSANRKQCPDDAEHDNLISELEKALTETLYIEEVEEMEHASNSDSISEMGERNECEWPEVELEKKSQKVLTKCASFPYPNNLPLSDASSNAETEKALKGGSGEDPDNTYTRSISLPVSVLCSYPVDCNYVFCGNLLK